VEKESDCRVSHSRSRATGTYLPSSYMFSHRERSSWDISDEEDDDNNFSDSDPLDGDSRGDGSVNERARPIHGREAKVNRVMTRIVRGNSTCCCFIPVAQ
jgi:hypothetical protein